MISSDHTCAGPGSRVRKAAIVIAGILCIAAALIYRASLRPEPAPLEVQNSGKAIIRAELVKLGKTDFGKSRRGQLLLAEVSSLLEEDRIVFSSRMNGPRGLCWRELAGPRIVFIRVLEMNYGKYLHQLPCQISEALFHEAVHSIKGSFHGTSIEEECDAFAAGVYAEFASRGVEPPELLTMDGMPIAEFVIQSYPESPRKPDYQPVGVRRGHTSK